MEPADIARIVREETAKIHSAVHDGSLDAAAVAASEARLIELADEVEQKPAEKSAKHSGRAPHGA